MNDMSMNLADVQLDDADAAQAVQGTRVVQRGIINDGLEQNPDKAAEAQDLSDVTGESAPWIAQNLDEYKEDLRRRTAHELVLNNPDLVTYIQSHPLASAISGDDWHNLDKYTREAQGKPWRLMAPMESTVVDTLAGALKGGLEGASEGLGHEPIGDWARGWASEVYDPVKHRLGWSAAAALGTPAEVVIRGIMAGMGAAGGAAVGGLQGLGLEPAESQRITEAVFNQGMAEAGLHAWKPATALDKAKPWLTAGEEMPTGIHPEIDQAKAKTNAQLLDAIDTDLANATASATRERAPELFQRLTGRMYGDHQIGIGADAALALYGDKPPAIDDGLLGWVPNIESQLAAARDTGDDISVPLKDWIAKVDPEVAKGLHDHIRAWQGGITEAESKLIPTEPKATIDEALPAVRAAAGLEPKFSIGDRKLTLQPKFSIGDDNEFELGQPTVSTTRGANWWLHGGRDMSGDEKPKRAGKLELKQGTIEPGDQFHPEAHNWSFLDENGKDVGALSILPGTDGKTLYVDWIGGQAGLWANSFGPALIRDIKRQLKSAYPDYEYLTGHRVSGAREGVNNFGPMPLPRVRLDVDPEDAFTDHWRSIDILQSGWEKQSGGIAINRQSADYFTREELARGQATYDEIQKLTGGKINAEGVTAITQRGADQRIHGLYSPHLARKPDIIFDLLGPDSIGVGRHESIHFLKDYKLFTPEEWSKLEQAAHSEGWLDRYKIHDRYAQLDEGGKTEEAIAEGFREWAQQADDVRPKTGIGAVFQKIWDFLDRIRQGMSKYLGREPTWEEVFQRTSSGEVGKREPQIPEHPGQFKFSQEDQQKAIVEGITNLQAASVGMTVPRFRRLQEAIRKRAEEDLVKAKTLAEKEQAKRQTAEWKSNSAAMAKEVAKDIRQRPDVAADEFLGQGVLHGEKTPQGRYTLDAASLSPEQKAMLPNHYVSASGLSPDMVGQLFGYSSGDELVARLGALEVMRKLPDGGRMRHSDMVRELVKGETNRRMEAQYGNLQGNILDLAHDQALSESSINVMHEELMAAAEAGGVTAFDKSTMQRAANKLVAETTLGKLSSFRLMQTVNMHSRNAEASLLDGNFGEAAVHMQRQTLTAMVARLVKQTEKEVDSFNKAAKTWGKYKFGTTKAMPAEFANVIQKLLTQVGKKVGVTDAWLTREMQESGWGHDVRSFVDEKTKHGAIISPWEDLYDPSWKKEFNDLTTEEFGKADDFIRSLVKAGRDEAKVYKEGEAHDWHEEIKPQMVEAISRLKPVSQNLVAKGLRSAGSVLITHETFVDLWDSWDWKGPWNTFLYKPLKEGDNIEASRIKEITKDLQAIAESEAPSGDLPSPFRNPRNGQPLVATRDTLWAAMANQGNEDNMEHFAQSWGLTPQRMREWIDTHATKDDWDGVQKVLDTLKKTGAWSDDEYRRGGGRAMKGIEAETIKTQFGDYPGGYYPKMFHPDFPGKSAKLLGLSDKDLFGSGYSTGFAPGAGYRISRTEYNAPMALDMKQLPGVIIQQIHDGAMRNALAQAAKILRDPDIKDAMIEHAGHEVYDSFVKWIRRVANSKSPSADLTIAAQRGLMIADYVRRNAITNMVGLNLGTVEKHAPTAFFTSLAQVGLKPMLQAYTEIFGSDPKSGQSIRSIIHNESLTIQRRNRGWMESLYGSVDDLHSSGKILNKFLKTRDWMQWASSKPVALSDALSAEPMYWAARNEKLKEGESLGDSIYYAEKMVRKAHGETSVTSQPMVMNEVSKWFLPMFNFYNDVFNRAVESAWRAAEARRDFKGGDIESAKTNARAAAAGFITAIVMPAIIHNIVQPPEQHPEDGPGMKLMRYIAHPFSAWVPFGRDFVPYLLKDNSPDVGLLTAVQKQFGQFPKDLLSKAERSPAHQEKLIRDGGTFLGLSVGGPGMALGKWTGGAYGEASGVENFQGPVGLHDFARFGTTKGHARSLQEYMQGQYDRRR